MHREFVTPTNINTCSNWSSFCIRCLTWHLPSCSRISHGICWSKLTWMVLAVRVSQIIFVIHVLGILKRADEIASKLLWSWNPPNIAVRTRMKPGILCGGHEVPSCHGTVESCHHVAEDLVFATSVHLTRNTAFHPTLFYTELFRNKSYLRSVVLLSSSWRMKMLFKIFRVAFTSPYTLPVYCSQSFSENCYATDFQKANACS